MSSRNLDEEEIFHIARTMDDSAIREKYLRQICAGDQALRDRVEALLQVHEKEQEFLRSDAAPAPTVDQSPVTEAPGEQIGRYKLLQKIGEGGFGVVYMAEQERPVRRKVALKIIKPGMDSRAVIARFEAERQALALMDHPNIARVLDGGTTNSERPYFVMELVKGVPIGEYCDKNQLTTRDRLRLFIAVCQAVQHAHQKGIIHRDLKPANILVTLHDGQPVIKVIDFGVAKAIDQKLTEKTLFTSFGEMVGTLQYMSPEQAEMSGLDVDTRSDIYSLGVVLYELLTGTTPLEADRLRAAGYAEIQRIIREEEPVKPSTRLSTSGQELTIIAKHRSISPDRLPTLIKGDLDWIVMKSIEKDRSRRYDTPLGLSQDIQRFLNHEPVEASPPSKVDRLRKLYLRNRARFVTACVALSLLVLGSITTAIGWYRAERNANALNTSLKANKTLLTEKEDLAERNAKQSEELSKELSERKRRFYAAEMAEAFDAWREGDIARAQHLVNIHADSQVRKWEWHFLSAQLNSHQTFDLIENVFGRAMTISPDQNYIAVMHPQRWIFTLFDKATRRRLEPIGEERIGTWIRNFVEFSEDGRKLVHAANEKNTLTVREVPSCDVVGVPYSHVSRIEYAVFRETGRDIVFVDSEGNIAFYDYLKGTLRETSIKLQGATSHSKLALSQDEQLLVHGGRQVDLIDLDDMTVKSLAGHTPATWDIELIEESDMLVTSGFDRLIHVWNLSSCDKIKTLGPFDDEVRALSYDPVSNILAAATRARKIHRWHLGDFVKLPTVIGFHGMAGLDFDSEGDLYYLTQHNTLAKHSRGHDRLPKRMVHVGGIVDFCLSTDSKRVVVLRNNAILDAEPHDSQVMVFTLEARGLTLERETKLDFVASCIAPGQENTVLLGGRHSTIVRAVSILDNRTVQEISIPGDSWVTHIASSQRLESVGAGLTDGSVWIGRTDNLATIQFEETLHPERVSGLAWCDSSRTLISGDLGGSLCRTHLANGQSKLANPVDGPIHNLAVKGDHVIISTHVAAPLDRTIMKLDSHDTIIQRSAPFTFHASGITPLHAENTIVAVGQDRTLRFMDADTLETRVSFSEDEIFNKIISSEDDSILVAATREGSLIVYQRD